MSTTTVSPLRQRMIQDMRLRNLAPRTQEAYIRGCRKLASFLRRSPDTATAEDIRLFQLHLAEQGVSICTRNWHRLPVPGDAEVSVAVRARCRALQAPPVTITCTGRCTKRAT